MIVLSFYLLSMSTRLSIKFYMNIWGNEGTKQKYRKEKGEAPLV